MLSGHPFWEGGLGGERMNEGKEGRNQPRYLLFFFFLYGIVLCVVLW